MTVRPRPERLELMNDNERTFLAWLRTSIAQFALACAIAQFGVYVEREARAGDVAGVYSASLAILLVAIIAVLLGIDDYHRRRAVLERDLPADLEDLRARSLYPLAMAVGFAGCCLLLILLFIR